VIVGADGRLLSRGYHHAAGLPHAEIEALRALPQAALARGAEMFVTLEPCSTHGRTPPCCRAIIEAGIERVIIGATDPNPAHAGRAHRILRDAGIQVTGGVLEPECRELNAPFNTWVTTGLPYVIAKAATTLDGYLTRRHGEGRWITSPAARVHAHRTLRNRVDAILIGAGTLRLDDPSLTVRLDPGERLPPRQPWRVVLTNSGDLPPKAKLFTDAHRDRTLIFEGMPLREVLRQLAEQDVTSVLIEGGGQVLTEAFRENLVDRIQFYLAPILAGHLDEAQLPARVGQLTASIELHNPHWQVIHPDVCLTAIPKSKLVGHT
jgi:diaminohydroxyphosphoribosylaminopyrimidine deaminase/5-amino-6-(5-phosphoribosylamino)uracil reductase